MGWPESEFAKASVKRSILELSDPQQFMRIHFPSFAGKSGWMEKAFWTIKNNPEFDWSSGKSYVELPHVTTLRELISDIEIRKERHPRESGEPGRIYISDRPDLIPGLRDLRDSDGWHQAWATPTERVEELWKQVVSDDPYGFEFGMGSFELIKWPVKEGYPQKYLVIATVSRYVGRLWLALVTDINVPVILPGKKHQ
jgi:hypothetical protein